MCVVLYSDCQAATVHKPDALSQSSVLNALNQPTFAAEFYFATFEFFGFRQGSLSDQKKKGILERII